MRFTNWNIRVTVIEQLHRLLSWLHHDWLLVSFLPLCMHRLVIRHELIERSNRFTFFFFHFYYNHQLSTKLKYQGWFGLWFARITGCSDSWLWVCLCEKSWQSSTILLHDWVVWWRVPREKTVVCMSSSSANVSTSVPSINQISS